MRKKIVSMLMLFILSGAGCVSYQTTPTTVFAIENEAFHFKKQGTIAVIAGNGNIMNRELARKITEELIRTSTLRILTTAEITNTLGKEHRDIEITEVLKKTQLSYVTTEPMSARDLMPEIAVIHKTMKVDYIFLIATDEWKFYKKPMNLLTRGSVYLNIVGFMAEYRPEEEFGKAVGKTEYMIKENVPFSENEEGCMFDEVNKLAMEIVREINNKAGWKEGIKK